MFTGCAPLATSPLSLTGNLAERSSPSRVRFAAQNWRALDRSGNRNYGEFSTGVDTNPGSFRIRRECRGSTLEHNPTILPRHFRYDLPSTERNKSAVRSRVPGLSSVEEHEEANAFTRMGPAREKVLGGEPAHGQVGLRKAIRLVLQVIELVPPHEPDESGIPSAAPPLHKSGSIVSQPAPGDLPSAVLQRSDTLR